MFLGFDITKNILRLIFEGSLKLRLALLTAFATIAAGGIVHGYQGGFAPKGEPSALVIGLLVVGGLMLTGVIGYQEYLDQEAKASAFEKVESRALQHPEKPQFAWDLARIKLESYLDRNLAQVRSIYWLTLLVMLAGFGLIMYGLYHAFESTDRLPVAVVASASGVLVSLIGGSFLIIYRSILGQSKDYVGVLERINAVGMAVQVISNIPDTSSPLREQTTAELAKQLLGLYAKPGESTPRD